MNDAYEKNNIEGEVAGNDVVLLDDDASSPMAMSNALTTSSFRGASSSPTSMPPAMAVATLNLNTPSSLESRDTLTLAALYNSSRRSRNSPEKMKTQLPASTNLPPPPPLYSASGQQQHNQSLQSSLTSSAQPPQVSLNTMHDSWNTSMSSLMNSSIFNSCNSSALATNPPIGNTSPTQHRPHPKKNVQHNIDWSKLNNYSIEERADPPFQNISVPEGDDSSATAPLDDSGYSEYSHVRSRSDFEMDIHYDQEQEMALSPVADGCNTTELPPYKRNRRGSGSLRMGMMEGSSYEPTTPQVPANDVPATTTSRSSDTAFDIYAAASRASYTIDDSIILTPLLVHARSRNQDEEKASRRNSLKIEDLEEEQPSRPVIQDKHGIKGSQDQKLVRRKIQRLLLIRHCTKCSIRSIPPPPLAFSDSSNPMLTAIVDTGYFCPVTSHCAEGKALCAHIKACKLDDCTYPKCLTTREVLGRYMKCKDRVCKVCAPVRSRDKRRRNQTKDDDSIGTIDNIDWLRANMLL